MMILIVIVGVLAVMVSACILAYALSTYNIEKPISFTDKNFQIWAFGHLVETNISPDQMADLWNQRNPEHKIRHGHDAKKSIDYLVKRYEEQKKNKNT